MRRVLVTSICLVTLAFVAGCGSDTAASQSPTGSGTVPAPGTTMVAVQKDVLATDLDPPGAPGRTLTLIRYTIAPGAKLAPHIHPGVQLASIESGTLTYTIISGTAAITRAGGKAESATGPTTITLNPGDAVAEKGEMVHFGANDTDRPVVILATLLTEAGRDLAVTVTTTTP